jgi:hypothetical protein
MSIPTFAKLHSSYLLDGNKVDVFEAKTGASRCGNSETVIVYFAVWRSPGYEQIITKRRSGVSLVLHDAIDLIASSRKHEEIRRLDSSFAMERENTHRRLIEAGFLVT